jgi:hypothetical protein
MSEKRKQPVKTAVVTIHGTPETPNDYEGWWFTARTNAPIGAFGDISSGSFDRIIAGLSKIIIRTWNFVDEEAEDLPAPSEQTIAGLPTDLAISCANAYVEAMTKLPPV